ncbi:UDP-glucose 6-dehydrogenase [Thelohanellus kitauei]|uniref:UDP-glucose 6-dehydrogenase n=1 Tax=Thelohanellus kitauei TaxID=669202 RepID=A0A0C2IVE1_THEKT|nr:UDP-glucose 6-dehydrogenase [Thelohanellus kitauei]
MNKYQKKQFLRSIVSSMFDTIYDKTICIYGVAFKANTSDFRESAALYILKNLLNDGARIKIYDPCVNYDEFLKYAKKHIFVEKEMEEKMTMVECPYVAAKHSHAIVICTEWDIFKNLNYETIYHDMMKPAFVFDGRIILDVKKMLELGFKVYSIGYLTPSFF